MVELLEGEADEEEDGPSTLVGELSLYFCFLAIILDCFF
jgi:hypothetical protein